MKKTIKKTNRFISLILCLAMIISSLAAIGVVNEASFKAFAEGAVTTVVACSDFQNNSTNNNNTTNSSAGATFVQSVISRMQTSVGFTTADGFLCCGDYSFTGLGNQTQSEEGLNALKGAISDLMANDYTNAKFVQGNHDPASTAGLAASGNNDPASGKYGVFVINHDDYQWGSRVNEAIIKQTAENLRVYLNNKLAVGYTAPIFVVSHVPLHYSMRTKQNDAMYANYIFDVLNDAGNNGLNIVFLYGHDHSNGWDDYLGGSSVYLTKGDHINIAQSSKDNFNEETLAFTYMNAGFTGYYENHNGADNTLTMTVFQFDDTSLTINRVSESGIHNLKSSGVTNTYQNETGYSPDTSVVPSPQNVSLDTTVTKTHEIANVIPESTGSSSGSGSGGSGSSGRTYTRITSTSELVSGKNYLLIYNGSEFMDPVDSGNTERVGFDVVSTSGLTLADTISGDYSSHEWTFTASGSNWLIGKDGSFANLSRNANKADSYDATLGSGGSAFTIGGSVNAFTFTSTVNGTTVYLNKNSRGLINGYTSNAATFYIYGLNEAASSETVTYERVSASSLSNLEDGETYIIVSNRDNDYACSTEFDSSNSRRLAGVVVTVSGNTIEGSDEVTACEWIYDAATSSFKAANGTNANKYLNLPTSSSSAVTFSTTGVAYTYSNNQLLLNGSTYGLNLRSAHNFSSYDGGSTVYFYKKVVSGAGGSGSTDETKPIKTITLESNEGTVYVGAGRNVKTGATLSVTYTDDTTAVIPVTVGMLLDLTGNFNAVQYTGTAGDYAGLAAYYRDNWFPDFTLHVIEKEEYPEYPNPGSVRVGKSASAGNFQNSGVAQIELTATGVPMDQGIDVVLMLDTSSSMNNAVTAADGSSSTRIQVLRDSVSRLITAFNQPNEAGMVQDIDVAVADFNGYETSGRPLLDSKDHLARATIRTEANNAQVYTGSNALNAGAFVSADTLYSASNSTVLENFVAAIETHRGTNYDYAFDAVYQLVEAKKAQNEANQQNRDVYVIFMSDGAPFSYNYFSSHSTTANWNNWLQGTYASTDELPLDSTNPSEHAYFYNGPGNRHRMADAIKGSPESLYTVIKNDSSLSYNGQQYMTQVSGLGAKMYSIGFCLAQDSQITVESMRHVITHIASSEEYAYFANDATELDNAFTAIHEDIKQAATEAYFVDRMGSEYDLQLASTYEKNGQEFTLDPAPKIEVKTYTLYTNADLTNGVITDLNDVGTRRPDVNPDLLETVTFNADGTEAYSDKIDAGATNILVDGVINAQTFFYNTTSSAVMIDPDGDGTANYSLAPETFYWKIGIIAEKEFSLTYYVYLTGTMEGTRDPGAYPTNTSAILYYINYLGHEASKETVSPILPWQGAVVNYEFYLVNQSGQPVNRAGTVVPFENRIIIGDRLSYLIRLNTTEYNESYTLAPIADVPDNYTLFNPDASAEVVISSGTTGTNSVTITDEASAVTTYYYESGYRYNQNGTVPTVSDYYNTHFAFGVYTTEGLSPDAVVIDYGLPVKIHPIVNDKIILTETPVRALSTSFSGTLNTNAYAESQFDSQATSITLAHGTASVDPDNGDTVIYTPTDMQMSAEEVFYYEVVVDGFYYYSKITVIPAANIFYEESFMDFTDGDGYAWRTVGNGKTAYQAEDRPGANAVEGYDADNVYGYDPAYDDTSVTYSLDRAKVATLDAGSIGKEPTASFTFCGTGFDLFSVTSNKTGTVLVKVEGINGTDFKKTYIVNTYYGYMYGQLYLDASAAEPTATLSATSVVDGQTLNNAPLYESEYKTGTTVEIDKDETIVVVNGKVYSTKQKNNAAFAFGWLTSNGEETGLYQIPVISVPVGNSTLGYGTYKVTITPKYAKAFDKTGDGEYKIYIDGVRIYDPAGETVSGVIDKAYNSDRENNAEFIEVRDTIISANNFGSATIDGNSVAGTMFIDGISVLTNNDSYSAMEKFSKAGPNNELYLSESQAIAFIPTVSAASFQIGMKVAKAGASGSSAATVRILNTNGGSKTITVSGSAEKYYDISSLLTHDPTTDEYSANGGSIVVVNDSDCIIALTNYKFTSKTAAVMPTSDYVTMNASTFALAARAVRMVMTTPDTSGVTAQWETTDLKSGATATLTVDTPADIVKVEVDGVEITDCIVNEDGTKTWTHSFTVTENSSGDYEIVLTDSKGRISETIPAGEITVSAEEEDSVAAFFKKLIEKIITLLNKLMKWWGVVL